MACWFLVVFDFVLGVAGGVLVVFVAVFGCVVLWCILCVGVGVFDGEPGQAAVVRMVRGVVPYLLCFGAPAAYLVISGVLAFVRCGPGVLFGAVGGLLDVQGVRTVVTRFFTVALRVAAAFVAHFAGVTGVWLRYRSWLGHARVFEFGVVVVRECGYCVAESLVLGFDVLILCLVDAQVGDVVLFSGFFHSPWVVDLMLD